MKEKAPSTWWKHHSPDCGTKYRGCAPDCPKNHYEETGEWIGGNVMERVVIESPYAGKSDIDIEINEIYGRFCMRDCLTNHNETPYASHLLYTQKFVLRDNVPEERKLGIEAGFFWRDVAEKTVFYIDLGMTKGMDQGIQDCEDKNKPYEVRHLSSELWDEFLEIMRSVYPQKFAEELAKA